MIKENGQKMSKTHRIAVIPGDGIGKEVVPEGLRVLEAVAREIRSSRSSSTNFPGAATTTPSTGA